MSSTVFMTLSFVNIIFEIRGENSSYKNEHEEKILIHTTGNMEVGSGLGSPFISHFP